MVFAATKKMTLPVGTDLVHTVFVISQLLKGVPSVSVLMCVLWQVVQKLSEKFQKSSACYVQPREIPAVQAMCLCRCKSHKLRVCQIQVTR